MLPNIRQRYRNKQIRSENRYFLQNLQKKYWIAET